MKRASASITALLLTTYAALADDALTETAQLCLPGPDFSDELLVSSWLNYPLFPEWEIKFALEGIV
jgi:hypothetical protein